MAVAQWPFVAAVLLLVSSGLLSSSPLPACPEPCTCQRAPLLNCSSSGLSLVPQHIQDSVTELDLSHNLLVSVTLDRQHHYLRNVWLGNNSITRLSLCMKRDSAGRHVRGRQLHGLKPWSRQGCVSWAPTLQLLSVERNLLEELPEGLEAIESLQVLQLSFNRISTLQPGDLSPLWQLKELHLQHNLITSLHPQMFQDLAQLRVLDLSFNMLTSLHPLTYLSLRNIGADVRLDGNRWQCDCRMRSLRRWMAYDSSRGLQSWSVECASPSILSGRDLLQLEEDDLNCSGSENRPELHQDVTVHSGSEILLSCSAQDPVWWKPSGQASASQPQDDLLITDITERDTGLYVCVSEEHEVGSVFNLQISKIEGKRREPRSLPQGAPNRIGQEKNQRATQCNLTLAVCLSVIITFLIAFIIGVLVRPCIDILWRRVTKKKRSTETNSVSHVEQRQYDNEAYSNCEEPEVPSSHRERRVTFSDVDIRENTNVQYYDTVASGDQESLNDDAVFECEAAKTGRDRRTAEDSGSESSIRQSSPEVNQRDLSNAGRKHNIEFERIPDPVELGKRRSSSSSSDSSLSGKEDRITRRDLTRPKSPQLAKGSVQQRADFLPARKVELPQISEGSENLEFSSEPFADWSPHTKNPNLTDPDLWQENGEQFEFSDSVRSNSPRSSSVHGSFNDSKLIVAPTPNKQKRDETSSSSSSSYVSEGEPTEYTVNLDPVNEKDIESNHNKPGVTLMPSLGFNQGDPQRPTGRPKGSFSSHSSDSDGKDHTTKKDTREGDTQKKVVPMPRTKFRELSLGVINHGKKNRAPPPPVAPSSSSSSDSEAEIKDLKVKQNTGRVNQGIKISEPKIQSTKLDPQIKRSLDIKARVPASDSSSSSDSEAEATGHRKTQEQGQTNMARLPIKLSQTTSHDPQTQWPVLDLEHTTGIKRRLDIKVPSPASGSSSSSDSEDEKTGQIKKQEQGQTNVAKLPIKVSQTNVRAPRPDSDSSSSSDSEAETTGQIKKQGQGQTNVGRPPITALQPKIKAQKPGSESSSSSDSEAEKTGHIKKQEQGQINMAGLPIKVSPTASNDPQTQWPVLDLEHTTGIKRRLDIRVPSPASESSSSSNSEGKKTGHIKKQEQGQANTVKLPIKASQRSIKEPKPDSDSSSSSDSEVEKTGHIKKQEQGQINMAGLPIKVPQTASYNPETQWPVLDLEHTTRIKRRLDIRVPSRASESSSSSDSEDEKTGHIKKQEQGQANITKLPIKVSQTNVKAPRPDSDSSFSSDSEAETTGQKQKQMLGKVDRRDPPFQVAQPVNLDLQTRWPVLDLEHTTNIKRRLDIKARSPDSKSSSSSSDSDNEKTGHIKKQEQGQTNMVKLPIKASQRSIKAPRPDSESSSSSDSEAETRGQIKKQEQGQTNTARLPIKVSQTASTDPKTHWPVLNLEHTTGVKRRLDIKAPSPDSESSSSSDSGDEQNGHIKKQEQVQANITKLPIKVSQTNVRAPRPDSDSSSSSDSEAETKGQKQKQMLGKVDNGGHPFQVSQTVSPDLQTQWPVLDLGHTTRIKKRLDFKALSPTLTTGHLRRQEQGQTNVGMPPISAWQPRIKAQKPGSESSSSSDSDTETTGHIRKQEQGQINMSSLPIKISPTASNDRQTQWPPLDLEHTTRIKRRLDIKAPSPASKSSSSSDSEAEKTGHKKIQEQKQTNMAGLPIKISQTNVKAPTPDSESSSSSDSEAEKAGHTKKQEQGQTNMARLPIKVSQTNVKAPRPDLESSSSSEPSLGVINHGKKTRAPPPPVAPSSSSSSESEAEIKDLKVKQNTGRVNQGIKISETKIQSTKLDPQIKRSSDIKARVPASDSSSSSDSEAEKTGHTKKQEQGQTNMARLPIKVSQTNVKAPRPDLESSSSSDSEAETKGQIKKQEQGQANTTSLFTKVSYTASNEPKTRWPLLDLEHKTSIKRRLDIKAPSPASESSSSSDSEDETTHHTKKERPELLVIAGLPFTVTQTVSCDPDKQWPAVDLGNTTRIKRRLDIKAPSPTPQALVGSGRDGKREEAIKVSSSSSSSSSDEQESSDLPLKVERDRTTVGITNNPLQTKLPDLDKSIPMVKRRLDIKAPSPQPNPIQSRVSHGSQQSNSSTSDSEDENHTRLGPGASTISKAREKKFNWSPKIPVLHTSRSPQTDRDIKLSKYTVITDGVGDKTSDNINTAPVVTPELESRWASMNLGISRFRKRIEITPHEPPNLPSSPPPDSPTSRTRRKRWGVGIGGITHTQSSITLEKASPSLMGQDDNSVESKERLRKAYSLPVTEEKSTPETMLTSSGNPHLKKYLDIKGSEKAAPPLRQRSHSSSSSDSENASTKHAGKGGRVRSQLNDTIDHGSPALSLGVQHTNRNLNIKAPSPESSSSSSSSSENEHEGTGYTAKKHRNPSDMLGVTENNSLITYKRQIFSSPTPDHTNQRQTGAEIVSVAQGGPLLSVGIRDESLAPRRVPSMNFDDVVKKRIEQSRHTTDVDLPPEIRWTGIGRQPSDLSISSTRRNLDINSSTPSAQPELHLLDSFNYSSNKSDDGTLRHEYSSLSTKSVHLATSRAIDNFDNLPDSLNKISRAVPEDRRQSKGLSALKVMSSERRTWDAQAENLDKGASPLFDDPQLDNSFYNRRPEKDIKPPEKRATDLLYDIPRYRRHDIGGIDQLQETPPPIPATPPPDVALELNWGSPQSSMKQGFAGTRSHLQLNRNRVEPDPSLNTSQSLIDLFDPINTNISHV